MLSSKEFIELAQSKVAEYFNSQYDNWQTMFADDVIVVWQCKTLQNHKALLITPVFDNMYYEATYNGNENELYLDAYKKQENVKYKLED